MAKKINPEKATPFNVIIFNPNSDKFEQYNVMLYLIGKYNNQKTKPVTFEECRKFIKNESQYQFWGRCEYEVILVDWPCQKTELKTDVHEQIMMNLDVITELFMKNVGLK